MEDTDFIQDPVSLPGDWLHWGKPFELAFRDHGESDAVPRKSESGAATLQTVDAGHAPEECQQLPLDREPVLRRESASPEEQKQGADEQAGRGRDDREQAGREQQAERPKRVRRAALPTTATPSARQKAHYADAQERLVELKAKPFFTTLVVAAMLAVAREFTEPKTFGDIKGLPDHSEWINACHEELLQFESKRVWEPFPRSSLPPRARVLPCQYVFALKKGLDGSIRRKARLVVCGNLERFMDLDTYASTSRAQSLRAFCAKAALHKLRIFSFDVQSAYLSADLDREVFVMPPPLADCPAGHVLRLHRAMYGLVDSARAWQRKAAQVFIGVGFIRSKADQCLFTLTTPSGGMIILLVFVDDILIARADVDGEFCQGKITAIQQQIPMLATVLLKYLGLRIQQDREFSVTLSQEHFAKEILLKFGMDDSGKERSPMHHKLRLTKRDSSGTMFPYRSCVGALMYLVTNTRPDLAKSVCFLARFVEHPGQSHESAIKRVLRYLSSSLDKGIKFASPLNGGGVLPEPRLICYTDADFGGDPETYKSTSGYLCILQYENNNYVLDWYSRKQTAVSRSTTEAELCAAGQGATEAIWMRLLLTELKLVQPTKINIPISMRTDSQSAKALAEGGGYAGGLRHVAVQYHFVRDLFELGLVEFEWIPTKDQLADPFTKIFEVNAFVKWSSQILHSIA